jgi:hypothetical protein
MLAIEELAFGVNDRSGSDQLSQRDTKQRGGLFQELRFGQGKLFEIWYGRAFEKGLWSLGIKKRWLGIWNEKRAFLPIR